MKLLRARKPKTNLVMSVHIGDVILIENKFYKILGEENGN